VSFALHPDAEIYLEKATYFYLKYSGPAIATRFLDKLYRAANLLAENTEIVSKAANGHRGDPLHIFSYSIVFVSPENRIRVLVVRHHRRRPSFGTRRI